MKISLLAGGYPPDLDGIGDYTCCLAKALAERTDLARPVTVYTRKGKHDETPGVRVVPFFELSRPSSIFKAVQLIAQDCPDWVVLQYNPFCWGARGFCPALPSTLRRVRKLPHAPKLAVMFHETTVPKWPWRFALMYAWQRPILRQVVKQSDRIFVSTKRWIPEIASAGSKEPAHLSPAGSNVPRSALTQEEARRQLRIPANALVLAVFGGSHPSRLVDWIAEAARAVIQKNNARAMLLHVGPEGDILAAASQGVAFKTLGICPAKRVADVLRAADCVLSPFVDGISTRRTSAIAALDNGIPVATTRREWTDDWFLSAGEDVVLVAPVESKERFASKVADWARPLDPDRSRKIQEKHDAFFAWPNIAGKMIATLS